MDDIWPMEKGKTIWQAYMHKLFILFQVFDYNNDDFSEGKKKT